MANQGVNLTQTASTLRNVIKYGAVLLVVIMVGRVFLTSLIAFWKAANPPPPPPPTMGFGPLPKLEFPQSNPQPAEYRLETLTEVSQFPDRMNVFFMPTRQANLLAVDRAKQKAAALGYLFEPEVLSPRLYRWTIETPIFSTLEMDIFTGTYTISSNWASYPELLVRQQNINPTTIISRVKSTVQKSNNLSEDVANGEVKTQFITALGGEFRDAASLSDADFLEVNMYRAPIDGIYPTVTAHAGEGPIRAIATNTGTILQMRMELFPVEYLPVESYPIRDVQSAWQIFSAGEGFIASENPPETAVIREIYLAYFEPTTEQSYYQPVYVFEGDDGFVGYLDAIAPTALQIPTQQTQ